MKHYTWLDRCVFVEECSRNSLSRVLRGDRDQVHGCDTIMRNSGEQWVRGVLSCFYAINCPLPN